MHPFSEKFHTLPETFIIHAASILVDAEEEPLADQAIVIIRNAIKETLPSRDACEKYKDHLHLDFKDYVLFPGLINSHTHVSLGFFRGLGQEAPAGQDDQSMIETFLFPAEKQLTADLTKPLSYACLVEGLKNGVTCFADHYYFSEGIGEAMTEVGVRGFLAETVADLGGAKPGTESWNRAKNLLENWPFPADFIAPVVGPHACDTVSANLMIEMAQFAETNKVPIHMHMSQTKGERQRVIEMDGLSPVKKAHKQGLLGEKTLAVHMISADDEDLSIIKDSGATIGFCPGSQILYEHCAPIETFIEKGIPFTVATDCAASNDSCDPLMESKLASLMTQHKSKGAQHLAPAEALKAITKTPAKVFGFEGKLGVLKPSALADIVFIKKDLSWAPHEPLRTQAVYSNLSKYVTHVMVDGKWVLVNGRVHSSNESDMEEQFLRAVAEIKNRIKSNT